MYKIHNIKLYMLSLTERLLCKKKRLKNKTDLLRVQVIASRFNKKYPGVYFQHFLKTLLVLNTHILLYTVVIDLLLNTNDFSGL